MLCRLAEMVEISPSKVLELVPEATIAQITAFLAIGEAAIKVQEGIGRLESSKASKRRVLRFSKEPLCGRKNRRTFYVQFGKAII